MGSRWFNLLIVLCWLVSMSWLLVAKVLPPLGKGEPPDYSALYQELDSTEPPVCWEMTWNGNIIGWATNRTIRTPAGIEVRSQVHFTHVPIEEMAPIWMRGMLAKQLESFKRLKLDANTVLYMTSEGELVNFRSSLNLADMPDSIRMYGDMQQRVLKLNIESAGVSYSTERFMPKGSLVRDELAPQTRIPDLKLGQTWTVETFNPLRPPTSPLELLQVKVEDADIIAWDGRTREAWVVVYRADSGLGFLSRRDARARLWVAKEDGAVVKQEMDILGSRLAFRRMGDEEAERRFEFLESNELPVRRERQPGGYGQYRPPEPSGHRTIEQQPLQEQPTSR